MIDNPTKILPKSPWLDFPRPNPDADLRLFCFHHAGGGGSIYRPWISSLAAHADVGLVQLPGRENRRYESLKTNIFSLVDTLQTEIDLYLDKPYAFFGHSMGALVALELARRLVASNRSNLLKKAIFSACRPPHLPREVISSLPQAAFMDKMGALGGTPPEILRDKDMMEMFSPILRADFAVCESSKDYAAPLLPCPIQVYGAHDDDIPQEDLASWQQYGSEAFDLKMFSGGHFYIKTHSASVLESLKSDLDLEA